MLLHVVRQGDTVFRLSQEYRVPASQIILDNSLPSSNQLALGQALVIQFPQTTYMVRPGDTLFSIGARFGIHPRQLYRNNPILGGRPTLYPGQTLVLSYQQEKAGILSVNGYAYPFINPGLLSSTLPFLTNLTPFTYGITSQGSLVDLNDQELIAAAEKAGTAPLMHLSTLTNGGNFSSELATFLLHEPQIQERLLENILRTLQERRYQGLDIDFEFLGIENAKPYADFIQHLTDRLHPLGYPVIAALAPKTSSSQPGELYEGHNYAALGRAADEVLLMTYEWGYTYGPPMAVAPLPNVRKVLEYALSEIPREKIWLGIPNYGYDWTLPFRQGESQARSISNQYAVSLALHYGAEIQYSEYAQSPYFHYTDKSAVTHEVWFEDARSIRAKLELISTYGILGAGYWNLMRPFTQNWQLLNALYQIRDPATI